MVLEMFALSKMQELKSYSAYFQRVVLLASLVLCCFSCRESEEPVSNEPSVKSTGIEVLKGGGAFLRGELSGHLKISAHGFLIVEDTSKWDFPYLRFDMGKPTASGKFEKKVFKGLVKDRKYFYRSYIEVGSQVIFGNSISFVSTGSLQSTITKIEPALGYINEYIDVFGEGFGNDVGLTWVSFDDVRSNYWTVTESKISVLIPRHIKGPNFEVKLHTQTGGEIFSMPYSLGKPMAKSISPQPVGVGEVLTITGEYFDAEKDWVDVWMDEIKVEIIESSKTELKIIVPENITSNDLQLKIDAQLQSVPQELRVKIRMPEILSYPDQGNVGETITITGKNFNPNPHRNLIEINGYEVIPIAGDTESLIIKIPDVPYPEALGTLALTVAGQKVEGNHSIKILDRWLKISDKLPFSYFGSVGSFVINDEAFVMTRMNANSLSLFKFNPFDLTWEQTDTQFVSHERGALTATATEMYLYLPQETDNFFQYNPKTNIWKKLKDFPSAKRETPIMFNSGGKIYIGPGFNGAFNLAVYDPSKDTWTELGASNMNNRVYPQNLVFGDEVFVFDGALNSGDYEVYKYHIPTNHWSISATNAPGLRGGTTAYIHNGKGYSILGTLVDGKNVIEFDFQTEKWTLLDKMGLAYRGGGFSFVLKGKVYAGSGDTGSVLGSRELYVLKDDD